MCNFEFLARTLVSIFSLYFTLFSQSTVQLADSCTSLQLDCIRNADAEKEK